MKATEEEIKYCRILTTSARETYNAIGTTKCSILGVDIVFNARGFHHLLNNSDGTPREVREKIHKLTLLPLAVSVIKNAIAVEDERDVRIRDGRKKTSKIKKGKTYALVARVGKKNPIDVRVLILRIGNGNYMFRSIMKH
jgi:hypothetical protein